MATPESSSLQILRILYFAIFMATFVFLGVGLFSATPSEGYSVTLGMALAGAAVGSAFAAQWLPPFLYRKALGEATFEVIEEPNPSASSMYRDQVPTRRVFASPEAAKHQALKLYFTPFILGAALAESVSIYGLVLLFLGAPQAHALPLFLISWVLLITRFPTMGRVTAPLEAAEGALFVEQT